MNRRSFIFIITGTLNSFLMIDFNLLRKKGNFRLVVLLDDVLKSIFLPYEKQFDQVYYISLTFSSSFFIESFPIEADLAIKNEIKINKDIRLISFFEGDIEATAKLRDQFNIPGMGYQKANMFRNKLLMKDILSSQGILVPKGFLLDLSQNPEVLFEQCKKSLEVPFIVKPVHLAASLGVESIKSYNSFLAFYSNHLNTDYMAEEEIKGDLYHLDVVVSQKNIKWFGCSQYNLPTTEFMKHHPIGSMPLIEKNNQINGENWDIPSELLEMYDLYEKFKFYAQKICNSFQVEEGILHIEVFKTLNALYFLEIAARPSGGLVVSTYRKMFGYNMVQAAICYEAGLKYKEEKTEGLSCFWACFPSEKEAEEWLKQTSFSYLKIFSENKKMSTEENFAGQHYKIIAYDKDYLALKKQFFALGKS